ncbi:Amylosucrase, partial [human gut metagenome]
FCSRLAHWYPDLIDGLTTLYGEKAEGTAAHLAAKAAQAYAERSGGLRRLDLDRTLDPLWAQDPSRIGYAAYTER